VMRPLFGLLGAFVADAAGFEFEAWQRAGGHVAHAGPEAERDPDFSGHGLTDRLGLGAGDLDL
jgi:hypothetical protein